MSAARSLEIIPLDTLERVDEHTVLREVTVRPGMCGHNALFVGQIGDWTWDTVSRLCAVNAFRAVDANGEPTYLSFYYYQVFGDRDFHLRTPTFGDRLQVVSTCYALGTESVLTLHRVASAARRLAPELSAQELFAGRIGGCLYVQNVNRWIRRGKKGNTELYKASPVGFHKARLPALAPGLSPRGLYDAARRQGAFAAPAGYERDGEWTVRYRVDVARDLNGVGLLCFASYFSMADTVLANVWHILGRSQRSFLERVVLDTRVCFLGNAEPGALLLMRVRRSVRRGSGVTEWFDVQITEAASQRLVAVVALECEGTP